MVASWTPIQLMATGEKRVVFLLSLVALYFGLGISTKHPHCPTECSESLLTGDGRVPDSAITARRVFSSQYGTAKARLNVGGLHSSWCSLRPYENEWLQIDLGTLKTVNKVATQGIIHHYHAYVTRFTLGYSRNGAYWMDYHQNNTTKTFDGNVNGKDVKEHLLVPTLAARLVRFNLLKYVGHLCMRVDLYGCECALDCPYALGLEDGRVPDSALSASSFIAPYDATRARLNGASSWTALDNDKNQWLQVDWSDVATVTGLATQGGSNGAQWVLKYQLSYSDRGEGWVEYRDAGFITPKIFIGNNDTNTIKKYGLSPTIEAQYIRIYAITWHGGISMRVELYGYMCDCNRTSVNADWLFLKSLPNAHASVLIPNQALNHMSMCLWFNASRDNSLHTLVSIAETSDYNALIVMTVDSGRVIKIHKHNKEVRITTPYNLHSMDWYHICVTVNGVNGTIELFLNGESILAANNSEWMRPFTGQLSAVFGQEQESYGAGFQANQRFSGRMSRLNIWSYIVSRRTIRELSTKCATCLGGNLLAWRNVISDIHAGASLVRSSCPLGKGSDCLGVLKRGYKSNGYYMLTPQRDQYFTGFCDQQTNGGGWLVVHNRFDGSVNFSRGMDSYRLGFGVAYGEFWLGLNKAWTTYRSQTALIEIRRRDHEGPTYSAFDAFLVNHESQHIIEGVGTYSGMAGDFMTGLINHRFRTKDKDGLNDCVKTYKTPGWNDGICRESSSSLNGEYSDISATGNNRGIFFDTLNSQYSQKEASMKIRERTEIEKKYALSFPGTSPEDYILYTKVKGFKTFYVCTFIKSAISQRRQGLFGFYSVSSILTLSISDGSAFYLDFSDETITINLATPMVNDSRWSHVCFTWNSADGKWKFMFDGETIMEGTGLKSDFIVTDGSLMIGQLPNRNGVPKPDYAFSGQITLFDFKATSLTSSWSKAGGCELIRDSYIPWNLARHWTHGNVDTLPVFMCNLFKVKHKWRLAKDGSGNIEDASSTAPRAVTTDSISTELNSIDTDSNGWVNLGDYSQTCIKSPDKCLGGMTVSFWMKYPEFIHSRILDYKREETLHLRKMLEPLMDEVSGFELCYRASKHGFNPADFYKTCESDVSISATLVIVKVKEFVFGGLLDVPWKASNPNGMIDTPTSFLFSLKSPIGCAPFKIYPKSRAEAARHVPVSGPVFGRDDLHIGSVSLSDLGQVYNLSKVTCPGLSSPMSREEARKLLAGTYYFQPDEIEVFKYKAKGLDVLQVSNASFIGPDAGPKLFMDSFVDVLQKLEVYCCSSACIKTFYIEYSTDNETWASYPSDHQRMIFHHKRSPGDTTGVVYTLLPPLSGARYIRVVATECSPPGQCCASLKFHKALEEPQWEILASAQQSSEGLLFQFKKKRREQGEYKFAITASNYIYTSYAKATDNPYEWTHVVLYFDDAQLYFYLDGKRSEAFTGNKITTNLNRPKFFLGKYGSFDQGITPNLRIRDLRVWDSPLTLQELLNVLQQDVFRPAETSDLAYNRPTRYSEHGTTPWDIPVNGDRNLDCPNRYFSWWRVTLQETFYVTDVFIVHKPTSTKFRVQVSETEQDANPPQCGEVSPIISPSMRIYCKPALKGRYVTLKYDNVESFGLCAVEVKGLRLPGFMYVNSTYPANGTSRYHTPYQFPNNNCLNFHYRMNGSFPGRLNVYSSGYQGKETLLWRLAGNHGDEWRHGRVAVQEDIIFKVVFEAINGKRYDGEIAVDNISLVNSSDCMTKPDTARLRMAGIQSSIVNHLPESRDRLEQMLSQAGFGRRYWRTCYRSLEHGWNGTTFHRRCDGKGPLLSIIRNGANIVGAFFDRSLEKKIPSDYDWALGREATQSSDFNPSYVASLAVDGNLATFTHTAYVDNAPWLKVDLTFEILVFRVRIFNRENCCLYRLRDFEIRVGSDSDHNRNPSCGGLHNMTTELDSSFDCPSPMSGRYVSLSKNTEYLHIREINIFGYPSILSERSFIFSLKESGTDIKESLKPSKTHLAAYYNGEGLRFGLGDLTVNLDLQNVENSLGNSYRQPSSGRSLTGQESFNAHDVEVMYIGDTLCDPPCITGEFCDEILGICICDESKRDVELCYRRRELQNKRDNYCALDSSIYVKTFARYDLKHTLTEKEWRCYSETALTDDRRRYNKTRLSSLLFSRHSELSEIGNDFPELVRDRIVFEDAVLYLPLDDPKDVRVLNAHTNNWGGIAHASAIRGIVDQALSFRSSSPALIISSQEIVYPNALGYSRFCDPPGCTMVFWLRFTSNPGQVFISYQTNSIERGFRVSQAPLSKPHVSFSVTVDSMKSVVEFEAPEGIWNHYVLSYKSGDLAVFLNGKQVEYLNRQDEAGFNDTTPSRLTIGAEGSSAPDADLDELMFINSVLSSTDVSNMYKYYKGLPNLYINSSIIFLVFDWATDYLDLTSKPAMERQAGLQAMLRSVYDDFSVVAKYGCIHFWNADGKVGMQYLVRYNVSSYSVLQPWVTFLDSKTYLKTSHVVNDVYITPLQVSAFNFTSPNATTLTVKWNTNQSRDLPHGIFAGYKIVYVNTADQSDRGNVTVERDVKDESIDFELTDLRPYTIYQITVSPQTLEGDGAPSTPIFVHTDDGAPLQPPMNFAGHNTSSTSILLFWSAIPEGALVGPLHEYRIEWRTSSNPVASSRSITPETTSASMTGLQKFTNYSFRICGVSPLYKHGPISEIYVYTDQDVPTGFPLNVQGSPMNSTALLVTWQEPPQEDQNGIITGYQVQFHPQGGGSAGMSTMLVPSSPAELVHLQKFTLYDVNVAAVNSKGVGPPSPIVTMRTGEDVPTAAPNITEGFNTSSTSIFLRWTTIPANQLPGILRGFLIQYSAKSLVNESGQVYQMSYCLLQFNITGLEKQEEYLFRVAAFTAAGKGPWSEPMAVLTDADKPEGTISNVTFSEPPDSRSVQFSLQPLSRQDANGMILGYRLYFLDKLRNETFVQTINASLSHTLSGLHPYTDYEIRVAAFTVKGEGNASEPFEVKTMEDAPSKPPRNVSGQNASSTSVIIQWSTVDEFYLNGQLRAYVVTYWEMEKPDTKTNITVQVSVSRRRRRAVTSPSLEITGLKKYTSYSVQVLAVTNKEGVPSLAFNITTAQDVPAAPPSNITANNVSSTELEVIWRPVPQKYQNGIVLGYKVMYRRADGEYPIRNVTINNGSQLSHVLKGLKKYGPYDIRLLAFTVKGEGNVSESVFCRTAEDVPAAPPSNITANNVSSTELEVIWRPVPQEYQNGIVLGYKVMYRRADGEYPIRNVTINSGSQLSHVLTGLKKYGPYDIRLLALTVKGEGNVSESVFCRTAEDVPAAPPSNITANNVSSTELEVIWRPVPQEYQNGIVLGYKVMYRRADGEYPIRNVTINNGSQLSHVLTGLKKYGPYDIRLLALTVKGEGNVSESVFCRTAEHAPDGTPGNVTLESSTLTELTLHWGPILPELENGIITGYHINVYELSGNLKTNATVPGRGTLKGVVGGLEVWTNYTVSVCGFTSVGDGPWSVRRLVTTDEQAPQDSPANVTAVANSSTSIRVDWDEIDQSMTRGIARGYRIYYRASDTPFPTPLLNTTVGVGERSVLLVDLYKFVRYTIYVVATTNKDGPSSDVIQVFTLEDIPDRPPVNLQFALPSPTSLDVIWSPVPFGYQNGIILGYKITCTSGSTKIYQDLYHGNSITRIEGLESYTLYNVTIRAYTSKGEGPMYSQMVLTDENNPCHTPQNLTTDNFTSTSSLPVSWDPIPSHCVPGILLGYRVRYKPVSTGDVIIKSKVPVSEVEVGPSTQSVTLTGLDIYTQYRIEVAGFTIKGDGPFATTFGDTCRCNHRLTTSWMAFKPYVTFNESIGVSGLIPSFLEDMTATCCLYCKIHGHSYVDFYQDAKNQSSQQKTGVALRAAIDGTTDLIFPIPGYFMQEEYKTVHSYTGIVQTSGLVFVLALTNGDKTSSSVFYAVVDNWPLVLVSFLSAYIMGILIWFLDAGNEHFPRSFIRGSMEGFWWSYVSMTTVGYGDRCPVSVPARILSIGWTLAGVVIIGILVGSIATSLSSITIKQASSLYGHRVAAIKNSYEYRFGLRMQAIVDVGRDYQTYDEIYTDMVSGFVEGALLDTLGVGSRKDLFEKPFIRMHKFYDASFVRGVVMSGNSRKLKKCFHRHVLAKAQDISDMVKSAANPLEVPLEPLSTELSSSLFDYNSQIFKKTLTFILVLLGAASLLGLCWELINRKKKRKILGKLELPLEKYRKFLRDEMQSVVNDFHEGMKIKMGHLKDKHKQEIKCFLKILKERRMHARNEAKRQAIEKERETKIHRKIAIKYHLEHASDEPEVNESGV
ncbi:uncharacterized protein LOC5513116 isoform X3 [Nematostella vectensis]|uniref:uncharacterized protein LOC5513116 isoform X3 n=1 Tax=Nematostella vectensis TaxID=45351 RepID=UPI0020777AE1|nr:uncharacterized protein LOC5513116 isoform X3 [Nematostella vectensis]